MGMRYWAIATGLAALTAASGSWAASAPSFGADIQPILSDRCYACHGPDAAARKADLRLDLEDEAKLKAIIAGDADKSPLMHRIASEDPDERMPPEESNKPPLTPAEVDLFRRWIAGGAAWEEHWAFKAPVRPDAPIVANTEWARNEIDGFVMARLEKEGLAPSPETSREKLLRRVYFDLIGTPPSPQEIDAFLLDNSPEAYENVVDRLLASPHYGERMAVNWLDGARFADTNGFQNDFARDQSPWRDWVIRTFNDNMPYDQFTVEQIAGDMLPNATEDQRIATGFCRNNRSNTEGGSVEAEWYVENRVDRVETVSAVFLGLTMGCARCHDHKYDPISQEEFYRFYGFFNSSADKGFYEETRGNAGPMIQLPSYENQLELARFDKDIADQQAALQQKEAELVTEFDAWRAGLAEAAGEDTEAEPVLRVPLHGRLTAYLERDRVEGTTAAEPVWSEGLLGSALTLDGTAEHSVELGSAVNFERDKPFAISAWVRPEGNGALIGKMDDANASRGVDVFLAGNGEISVHLVNAWPDNAIKVTTDKRLENGVWSHILATYDGSSAASGVKIYVGGRRAETRVEVDKLNETIQSEVPLRIGGRSTSNYLKGEVADLKFFAAELSRSDAEVLMNGALARAFATEASEERKAAAMAFVKLASSYELDRYRRKIEQVQKEKADYISNSVPSVMVMQELPEPNPTYRLVRGEYDKPDTEHPLEPGVPHVLPSLQEPVMRDRLGLARWLASADNPLTARVMVNRLWAKFFGKGIVRSLDNFGVQGDPPTHSLLLDWLATEFVESGWDLKAIQKKIVMSATYRQDSAITPELQERDPENRLLARGPRYRLPAELVRDNALAASGLLSDKIGGMSVRPYQPDGLWDELAGGASQGPYVQSTGEDLYRRSLYTYRKRTVPHPTLAIFDAPSFERCEIKRATTNTPLQSLALLNDTTYVEAARHLARRMLEESGDTAEARIDYGFRLATGRLPGPREREMLLAGLERFENAYEAAPEEAAAFLQHGDSAAEEHVDNPVPLAAYTALATTLLNLDETITKE
ncbi:MAG: DUF1553 domain-containing protein [Candidatus Hydrogenedens sp.]|nr:DUF1553 domain-containing protein [Candidatus Hydrogenedens sp.]